MGREAAVRDRYVVGLIGTGIRASLSPALHEREADALGLRYAYQLIDLDVLGTWSSQYATHVRYAVKGKPGPQASH